MKKKIAVVSCLILLLSALLLPSLPSAAIEPEGNVFVTVNTEPENVCCGIDYPLPAPTAADESGNDLTELITVTVQRYDGDWTDVGGFTSVPWQPGMTFPVTEHAAYRVIYAVPEGGESAQAIKTLTVMDTLLSVSVSPAELRVPVGSAIPSDALTVTAFLSGSGSTVLSPDGYSLNTDGVDFETAGDYSAVISVTSPYGGTKTAELRVIVEADEPDPGTDLSSLSVSVNAEGTAADIPFGGEYTAPGVTVTATDAEGNPIDLSGSVLVSVYLIDDDGRHPVEGHENLPDSPAARRFPITVHGTYAVVYSVTNGSLSESAEYLLTVHDTLQSVSVLPDTLRVPVGEALPLDTLTVRAVYSLSGEVTVPAGGYTLNADGVDPDTAGEYTVTVSVTEAYGGTKTAEVRVTVYEDVPGADLSSVSIAVSADGSEAKIPFGGTYSVPGVTVTATDVNGDPIDLSANAVFTVEHGDGEGDWTPVAGLTGSAADDAARRIPITEHGVYRIVYSVTNGTLTAEAKYFLAVQDTLLSVSVSPYEFKTLTGNALSFDGLTVTALYSRSGEVALSAGSYTLDTSAVNTDQPGEYTAVVSFTDTYGGTKTANLKVTVYSDAPEVDLSSLSIRLNAASNQANAAFGYVFTLPDVTVTATDKKGAPLNLANAVVLSVYHADSSGWQQVSGFINVKNTAAARSLPISLHGSYRVVYSVDNGDLHGETEYLLNVQDTLTGITAQATAGTVFHPGDRIDPGLLNVTGTFSRTGNRRLNASEFTVSPATAPQKTGNFTVTITVTRTYEGVTVKKTAALTMTVVPVEQKIDKSRVTLTVGSGKDAISFGELCRLPDVTAAAFDADGNEKDVHDSVTWTLQHTFGEDGEEWQDVEGFVDLPITQAITDGKPLLFLPAEHAYYRVIYSVEAYGKEDSAAFGFTVMDTLLSIRADLSTIPLEYSLGEDLDFSGFVVNREFSWSGASPIPYGEYRIDRGGYDRNTAGTYTVTVSYSYEYGGTKTDSFTVTVSDPLSDFKVSKYPSKRVYAIGEPLDISDLEAKAFLPEMGEVLIKTSALEIVGFDPHTAGTQTIEILFHGVSGGTYEITVNDALFSIEIDASGVAGEVGPDGVPDYSGLKVTWIGVSGQRRLLTPEEYTVSPSSFKGYDPGSYSVTVSCTDGVTGEEHTASFRVTVTGTKKNYVPFFIGGAGLLVIAAIVIAAAVKKKGR